MYRYFVVAWPRTREHGVQAADQLVSRLREQDPDWRVACSRPGMLVLDTAPRHGSHGALPIAEQGVLLGTLFRKPTNEGACERVTGFGEQQARQIVRTCGRALVDDHWGRYVAWLRGPGDELYVLRDPTAAMACYHTRSDDLTLFCSHTRDLLGLGLRRSAVNWRHLGAYLHFSRVVSDETGLQDVQQVRAGECLRLHGSRIDRTFYWDPASIYRSGVITDPRAAARLLRIAVMSTVATWSRLYPRMLLELSGGLDSSIVLACLARAGRRDDVLCFNMFTPTQDGDERVFAQEAARRVGCELVATPFRPTARTLQQMLSTAGVASPAMGALKSEAEDARARYCNERRLDAVLSGQGGDNFFQRRKDSSIPAEYVRRNGLDAALAAIVLDTARLTGKSVWSVLAAAATHGVLRRKVDPYSVCKPPSFWDEQASSHDRVGEIRHPWVDAAGELAACKTQQVFDVVDAQLFYAQQCEYADIVHPLISQPVIECAVRIPCYVLTSGGRERALARDAFADSIPPQIAARTTKGAATGYFQTLLMENVGFIRELLLDGALVRERMLDRNRLEAALSYGALLRGAELGSVLHALMGESWLAKSGAA